MITQKVNENKSLKVSITEIIYNSEDFTGQQYTRFLTGTG